MALLLCVAWLLDPTWMKVRWLLATCGYICFFTGVPTFVFRLLRPARSASLQLRVAVLMLLPLSMILPDLVHYVLWRPDVLDLKYSARHLLNPIRTLANWNLVETRSWFAVPFVLGVTGLIAYIGLILMGAQMTAAPASIDPHRSASAVEDPAGV
jgi:hypothetical protein